MIGTHGVGVYRRVIAPLLDDSDGRSAVNAAMSRADFDGAEEVSATSVEHARARGVV